MAKKACASCSEEETRVHCELCQRSWCLSHAPDTRSYRSFSICEGCGVVVDALPDQWRDMVRGLTWAEVAPEVRAVLLVGHADHRFWYDLSKRERAKRGLRAALIAAGLRTRNGRPTEGAKDVVLLHSLTHAGGLRTARRGE
jgi:hypothetical protein